MLEPTDEDTAISPNPFRATITLVIKSGIEVPAAKNVNPMTYKCYGYFIITCFLRFITFNAKLSNVLGNHE